MPKRNLHAGLYFVNYASVECKKNVSIVSSMSGLKYNLLVAFVALSTLCKMHLL